MQTICKMTAREKIEHLLAKIDSGQYIVKEDGTIWNSKGKELTKTNHGYRVIKVKDKTHVRQHRLLYAYYHGIDALDFDLVIHHEDYNKQNNRKENLIQMTNKENSEHGIKYGTSRITEDRNHSTKLTREQAEEIKASSLTYRKLAKIYGVGCNSIWKIKNGITWK